MTYSNGLGGRHRNGDKRKPAHDKARASVGGNRTSLLTESASDPWMMDGQDLDWPGNPPPSPQGNYPYPAAPSGGGAPSYREPAPQYQGPRQRMASGLAPVQPARPQPGNTGPMPPYGHPSGPMRQYNPPPAPEYSHPSGPMRQYNPATGPMRQYTPPARPVPAYDPPSAPRRQYNPPPAPQYNHPSGPLPQYGPPSGPMLGYDHPSGPLPQYDAPTPQYNHPSGPMRQYDPPSGPMPGYDHPSGPMRQYNAPPPDYAVQYARDGVAVQLDRIGKESGKLWTVDSVRLANQILSTANYQADELRNEAQGQASASLAEARQEADTLLQQAADRAAATLATAEQEAAEIRAAVMKLSAELGGVVSAYVTENLLSPARPAVRPTARPGAMPPAQPATETPAAKPAAKPVIKPTATPGVRPAGKPNARSRQYVAVRAMSIFTAALVLFALTAGASEVALHGFKFFVFRSAGVGETSGSGLQENQGPGQPDAIGAHR
jgi:hypothetical protein